MGGLLHGVFAPGGVCLRGVSAPGGCTWSQGVYLVQVRQMPVNILPCPKLRLRMVIS